MRKYLWIGLAVLAVGAAMLTGCSSEPKEEPTPPPPPAGAGPQAAPAPSNQGGAKPMTSQ